MDLKMVAWWKVAFLRIRQTFLKNVIILCYFIFSSVQPKTKTGTDAQYAIAIIVPQAHCTEEGSDIQNVFSREDAEHVRNLLTNRVKCVLCTPSQNVIAARPTQKPKEHAEHVLLYPLGNSPMDKLLAQADQNSCVVFYSYNSLVWQSAFRAQTVFGWSYKLDK